ncbi:MAG: PIN domain-containing protein [Chthoniobacterales bacterium]
MICLDANYLIGGISEGRPESAHLQAWFEAGERFFTAAPAWYEFLCGPVTDEQIATMRAFLTGGILSFDPAQAEIAARLFNAVKRPRRLRVDAMIAAAAIVGGGRLATLNTEDFGHFVSHGLELLQIPEG